MPLSNPSLPAVPGGLHVDELTLDPSGCCFLPGPRLRRLSVPPAATPLPEFIAVTGERSRTCRGRIGPSPGAFRCAASGAAIAWAGSSSSASRA